MKINPTYTIAGAALGFLAVAWSKGTWKSHMAIFGAGAGAILFATVGAYYDAPKTADEVIAADKKLAETAKAKAATANVTATIPVTASK